MSRLAARVCDTLPEHDANTAEAFISKMLPYKIEFIEQVDIQVRSGYELVPLPEGSSYLGFIFARAPTPAQAETALRKAHAQLRIVVAPLWKASVA